MACFQSILDIVAALHCSAVVSCTLIFAVSYQVRANLSGLGHLHWVDHDCRANLAHGQGKGLFGIDILSLCRRLKLGPLIQFSMADRPAAFCSYPACNYHFQL